MHDIKFIRDTPEVFDKLLARRGILPFAGEIVKLDKEYRANLTQEQNLQKEKNDIVGQIAIAKKQNLNTQELEEKTAQINDCLKNLVQNSEIYKQKLQNILMKIPNLVHNDVPFGKDENDNKIVKTAGTPALDINNIQDFQPLSHYTLGENLGMMDFEMAAKISGPRFTILKKDLAKLDRAIASFMIDSHVNDFEYTEINTPVLVKEENLYGTGNLPKFAEDLFVTTDGKYLIPTAEVSLTNFARDELFNEDELPIRMTAYTNCFRSEAGSAGKDTRGMIRNHQFSKVELVSITTPEQEMFEHERMTCAAEAILQKLELPYRVVLLCSGDIGFSAQKTYDLEVWVPSEGKYREISSCSVCGSFQARRMNAKYKQKNGQKCFVSTLNGSGLAVGRTMLAILENYQQKDGSIIIPNALKPYMCGQEVIAN